MLLAMPALAASPEMKQVALEDMPQKRATYYGYEYTGRQYFTYLNCHIQGGILKVAFYLPNCLRLNGDHPAYEVYLDKGNRQFLTYDCLSKKWRDAKLDRLEWNDRDHATACWASEEDFAMIQKYFSGKNGGYLGILDFQRSVRKEQLNQYHKRITDPWDQDLEQVPQLPKDWDRWVDKVAVQENFIFYRYKRGGAKTGYCTFCEKEVPIAGHPYHNRKAAALAVGIQLCSRPWDAQAIFKRAGIMPI